MSDEMIRSTDGVRDEELEIEDLDLEDLDLGEDEEEETPAEKPEQEKEPAAEIPAEEPEQEKEPAAEIPAEKPEQEKEPAAEAEEPAQERRAESIAEKAARLAERAAVVAGAAAAAGAGTAAVTAEAVKQEPAVPEEKEEKAAGAGNVPEEVLRENEAEAAEDEASPEELSAENGLTGEEEAEAPADEEAEDPDGETEAPADEEAEDPDDETEAPDDDEVEDFTDDEPEVKRGSWKKPLAGIALGLAAVFCIAYGVKGMGYHRKFFPNTTFNGVNVSGLTAEEAEQTLNDEVAGYTLTVRSRGNEDAVIRGDEVGLKYQFGDTMQDLISGQNRLLWGARLFSGDNYHMDTVAEVNEEAFKEALAALPCMDESSFIAPKDAHLSDYISGTGYEVIPEENGTALDPAAAEALVRESVLSLEPEADFEASDGIYLKPGVLADDAALNAAASRLNQYLSAKIRYKNGDGILLDGDTVHEWLSADADGNVSLDESKVSEFVSRVAMLYDTYNKAKSFHTSWGQNITIRGGSYGWRVNQGAEAEHIKTALASGTIEDRTPEFSKTAASLGGNDYGNTYVEVNITAQHVYFYKDGKVVIDTDCVTGNTSRGNGTHTGIFQVAYKQKNAVLHGENYETPVNWWMPFNGGEGLHDANWRSSFGGQIYKTNGSHGCVNLPPAAAKKIFENISAGTPVIVYTLGGTGSSGTTPAQGAAAAATTAAAETTAAAAETTAAAAQMQPAQQPAPQGPGTPETSASAVKPAEPATQAAGPGPAPSAAQPETTAAVPQTTAAPETQAAQPSPGATSVQPAPGGTSAGPGASSGGSSQNTSAGPGASSGGPGQSSPGSGASSSGSGASSGGPGASSSGSPQGGSAGPGAASGGQPSGPSSGTVMPAGPGA